MDNLPADLLRTAGAGRVFAGGLIFDRAIEIGYRQTVQVLENESEIVKDWSTPRR